MGAVKLLLTLVNEADGLTCVHVKESMRGFSGRVRIALAVMLACAFTSHAWAQGPGFEVVSNGAVLELRFHGVPLKSVRADDNQNALSLDFRQPVDPVIFDRLNGAL